MVAFKQAQSALKRLIVSDMEFFKKPHLDTGKAVFNPSKASSRLSLFKNEMIAFWVAFILEKG